jgi:long-chain acyl-CoA synthetase
MNKITRLFEFPHYQLEKHPQEDALVSKINGEWVKISTQQYVDKAMSLSKGLVKLGVKPGDKVAIISTANCPEWNIADIGILQTGAVNVPVYPTITEQDYKFIFNDAQVKYCLVSDEGLFKKVNAIKNEVDSLIEIYSFEKIEGCKHWTEIFEAGKDIEDSVIQKIMDAVKTDDLATLIYTSGTTGLPKGVMVSHNNLVSNVLASLDRVPIGNEAKALSFLPVCHVFERMILYLYQYIGVSIYFAESIEKVGDNIKEVQPNIFTAVPRLIEKVYAKIIAKGDELTGVKKKLFFWAVDLGLEYDIHGKSSYYNFKLGIARKLIFSKWKEALGGNLDLIVSGSAALESSLMRVFFAAGIPIYEGYGLTETAVVVSVNSHFNDGIRIGTVGKVLKGVTVKIDDETGEILVKGSNVMQGYYNNQEKTDEVIDKDGWFHTGDKGTFVENNFLKITGRIKQIFKTSGGKYVSPELMENKFKLSPYIEQVMVIGEFKKHPAAFVVPSFEKLAEFAKENNISEKDATALVQNKKVVAKINEEIAKYNKDFANWEQVKKIEILDKEWSIDGGELTPTLKLKRNVIMDKNEYLVTKIYA